MIIYRNIYSNDRLTPAQKNYQTALVNDWIDNNGKSSRSINHLIKIDYRTASKSTLAEKGFTPSSINANEPEESVEALKAKQYIYRIIPNEFFLDARLTQVEKAYLIAIDFAWIRNDGKQILPVCHLETVNKYFSFVKTNTLKKYIRKLEEKGYIKYVSNRSGITNVAIDYTGNYNSIPEEFETAEEEVEEMISPRTDNSIQQQLDELKQLVSSLQKQVLEQQKQIDELKASRTVEETTNEETDDTTTDEADNEDCSLELLDSLGDTINESTDDEETESDEVDDTTTDTEADEADCSLEFLDSLGDLIRPDGTIKPTEEETKPTEEKRVLPKLSKDSLLAIMKPDLLADMKNEGLADLQHRSSSWNDLDGAEELQNNMAQRKNNKEELTSYIIDYINSNKDIRNTINCLDTIYYKIFFTLARTRVNEIKSDYWRRNIPTMDLNSISNEAIEDSTEKEIA